MSRFYKNGKLKDTEIVLALTNAANDYENGCLIEVRDLLSDIVQAIDNFTEDSEKNGL